MILQVVRGALLDYAKQYPTSFTASLVRLLDDYSLGANGAKISIEEAHCPVCREILTEPVIMQPRRNARETGVQRLCAHICCSKHVSGDGVCPCWWGWWRTKI
jgi:hypothetical protein